MERCRKYRYEVIKHFDKYVKVDDNWLPNFEGDTVHVTLTLLGGYIRFNVSGGGYFEVEKRYNKSDKNVFWSWKKGIYDKIPDVTNMKWFIEHGFHHVRG